MSNKPIPLAKVDYYLRVANQHRNIEYLAKHFDSETVLDKVLVMSTKTKLYNELYDCFVEAIKKHSDQIVADAMELCQKEVEETKGYSKQLMDNLFEEQVNSIKPFGE